MADETENVTPSGAPVDDDSSTTQDLRAALSRAKVDDLSTEIAPAEPLPSAAPAEEQAEPVSESAPAEDAFASALGTSATGAAAVAASSAPVSPTAPDMIQIPADHPMAQFYANTPEPPTFKSNRGIGVLIAVLGGVGFAVLLAGIIAALLAPSLSPSQFSVSIVEYLLSLAYLVPVGTFVVVLILLVLIVNRAGWWAYVLGGFIVGVLVWAAAVAGMILSPDLSGFTRQEGILNVTQIMLFPIPILAGVAAREVTVWFGAWIGARGRKIRAQNALALEEYEIALVESKAENTTTLD